MIKRKKSNIFLMRLKSIILLLTGFGLAVGAFWLAWDWAMYIHQLAPNCITSYWDFCLPFMLYCFDYTRWTIPFDISLSLFVIGILLLILGMYYSGRGGT